MTKRLVTFLSKRSLVPPAERCVGGFFLKLKFTFSGFSEHVLYFLLAYLPRPTNETCKCVDLSIFMDATEPNVTTLVMMRDYAVLLSTIELHA